jgi:sortase A
VITWRPSTRRAAVGTVLIVAGALLLIASATSYARGAIARDEARARWSEVEAQRSVADGRASLTSAGPEPVGRGVPIGRLLIPRVGLDEVVVEGVGDAELRAGPGHMIGSATPGARGTSVISAHRDRHFHALGELTLGDTIVTETRQGRTAWTISRVRVVRADAPVLRASDRPTLVLTTCWPIRYFGPAPERLILDAVPVPGA